MAQVKRTHRTTQISAATANRDFHTFLLMAQFEAKEIGARIAQARNEKGLTQEEVAEMASFSKRSLQDYEAGVTIPYRQLRELGRLLNKETEWFLYGDRQNGGDEEERWRRELTDELRRGFRDLHARLDRIEAAQRAAASQLHSPR